MTFDEAIEALANSKNNELVKDGKLTYGLYRAYDVVGILQKLKEEYAPTVEMTQEQVDELKKCTKTVSDEFDEDEIPSDSDIKMTDKLFDPGDNFILLRNMSAVLHPETIKVVDE